MEINKDKLLNEMKKKIAISNFYEEQSQNNSNISPSQVKDWRKYIMNKKKILNVISIFLFAVIILGTSTSIYAKKQWEISFKEYQNRDYTLTLATIIDAEESDYNENIKMDYIFQDNIGVKINSLLMTDGYLESNVEFKFPENLELNSETFTYGFAVYDENNNVYAIAPRIHLGNQKKYEPYYKNFLKQVLYYLEKFYPI